MATEPRESNDLRLTGVSIASDVALLGRRSTNTEEIEIQEIREIMENEQRKQEQSRREGSGSSISSSDVEAQADGPTGPRAELVDSRYGYRIVLSSFLVHFIVLGLGYSWGVFLKEFEDEFGASEAELAWPGSMSLALMIALGPLSGFLADMFGPRKMIALGSMFQVTGLVLSSFTTEVWHLYITYGALIGIGNSLAYFPSVAMVSQWYDRRKGLMTGIAVAGSGIGGFIMGPLSEALIETVGTDWTFRIFAGLSFCTLMTAAYFAEFRVPRDPNVKRLKLEMFKVPRFSLLFTANLFASFGYLVPFFFVPTWAEDQGLSASFGALALGLINGGSAVGRITLGHFADRLGRLRTFYVCLVIAGAGMLWWPLCTEEWSVAIFSVYYGLFAGGFVSLNPVIVADLFGLDDLTSTMGTVMFGIAFGNLAGPVTAGALYDDKPELAFIISGMAMIVGGILVFCMRFMPEVDVKEVLATRASRMGSRVHLMDGEKKGSEAHMAISELLPDDEGEIVAGGEIAPPQAAEVFSGSRPTSTKDIMPVQ
eukprot:Clim_evm93s108 gene=Clim_evmTU93s108